MAITPQAIKDQEFQVKFRGYDTVEVKAYLELIAEEFFELLEQVRQQIDELDVIVEERDTLQSDKNRLQDELANIRGSSEEIKTEFAERDSEVAALRNQIDSLKKEVAALEQKNSAKDRELAEMQTRVKQREQVVQSEKDRNDRLNSKIEALEKQNEALRSEEIDFKSTLMAAQQFTTDLKRKSEKEAREIISRARAEADKIRKDTQAELASYPAEIERLKKMRNRVRDDLEEVLRLCLDNLEVFQEGSGDNDYGELFQKIEIEDDAGDTDLESIAMDFELPGSSMEAPKEETFSMRDEMEDQNRDNS